MTNNLSPYEEPPYVDAEYINEIELYRDAPLTSQAEQSYSNNSGISLVVILAIALVIVLCLTYPLGFACVLDEACRGWWSWMQ